MSSSLSMGATAAQELAGLYKADRKRRNRPKIALLTRGRGLRLPYAYYDAVRGSLVFALRFGGDGGKGWVPLARPKRSDCGRFRALGPEWMVRYDKQQFPRHYRRRRVLAFPLIVESAPYPQGGYNSSVQALAAINASRAIARVLP